MIPPGRRRRFQNCQLRADDSDGVGRLSQDGLVFTPPYPCVYIAGAADDNTRRQRFSVAHQQSSERAARSYQSSRGLNTCDTLAPFRPWVRMHQAQTYHRPGVDGDVKCAGYVIGGDLQCMRAWPRLSPARGQITFPEDDGRAQSTPTLGRVNAKVHASAGACALRLLTISRHVSRSAAI